MQTEYVKKAQAQLSKINNGQDFMGLFKDYDDCQVNFQLIYYLIHLHLKSNLSYLQNNNVNLYLLI